MPLFTVPIEKWDSVSSALWPWMIIEAKDVVSAYKQAIAALPGEKAKACLEEFLDSENRRPKA